MSELKFYKLFHRASALTSPEFLSVVEFGNGDEVYLKSEADKVIAELEDRLQAANEQIENLINSASSIMLFQDRVKDDICAELRHQKYKRCLAMARWCERKRIDAADYRIHREKWEFYDRWYHRWLELAEKFKEAK